MYNVSAGLLLRKDIRSRFDNMEISLYPEVSSVEITDQDSALILIIG